MNSVRLRQLGGFALLLAAAWCVMVFVHEMGHVCCGWACGGRLLAADLAPWRLPYSLFDPDPRPLITLWGGPVLGVMTPLVLALLIRRCWAWFMAYFCLLANGVYLAMGWVSGDRYLDATQLLQHGAPPAALVIYCIPTIAVGYLGLRRQLRQRWWGDGVAGGADDKHPKS